MVVESVEPGVCSQKSVYVTRARKVTKTDKTRFFFAKKKNLLPYKQLFNKVTSRNNSQPITVTGNE